MPELHRQNEVYPLDLGEDENRFSGLEVTWEPSDAIADGSTIRTQR
jgi:hypothetical protein